MTTMWKTLHQLAAPRLYQICGGLVPWLATAGIIVLATGWVRGFGFAPADLAGRLPRMYLHVGGHLVDGYLCGDGGGGVHRAGLADEMASLAVAGDGAGGGGVHAAIALVTGAAAEQTDVGFGGCGTRA